MTAVGFRRVGTAARRSGAPQEVAARAGRPRRRILAAKPKSASATSAPSTGTATASSDTPNDPPASEAASAGLPSPRVVADDVSRVAPVRSWITLATPPPATTASVQCRKGSTSTTEEAISTVPATPAAGPARASSALSRKGTR